MISGRKTASEVGIQLPEAAKVASAAVETGTMSGPLGTARPEHRTGVLRRKSDVINVILRLLCLLSCAIALSLMVTAKEAATISIYGFQLPVYSKWSFSDSFEYLVIVSAAVVVHSVLQLLFSVSRLLRKSPVILSQNHAWLVFAGDQAFAYALMSAGSAASGVTNLNRTGIRHTVLPNFCKPLHSFCNHVAVAIAFTFVGCLLLATSTVLDVIWLSKY